MSIAAPYKNTLTPAEVGLIRFVRKVLSQAEPMSRLRRPPPNPHFFDMHPLGGRPSASQWDLEPALRNSLALKHLHSARRPSLKKLTIQS